MHPSTNWYKLEDDGFHWKDCVTLFNTPYGLEPILRGTCVSINEKNNIEFFYIFILPNCLCYNIVNLIFSPIYSMNIFIIKNCDMLIEMKDTMHFE